MSTTTISPRGRAGRLAYATLAALLLAGIATDAITHSSYWQIAVFGVGPDLALLYGGGRDLRRDSCTPGRCRSITSFIVSRDRSLWPLSRSSDSSRTSC